MKFLVDRCAGATLARWLRGKGHDVQEARERGPDPGDEVLLAQALAEGRVLVTLDKDFGALVFARENRTAASCAFPTCRQRGASRFSRSCLPRTRKTWPRVRS